MAEPEYPMNEIPVVEVFNKINPGKRRAVKSQVVYLIFKYWLLQGTTIFNMTGVDIVGYRREFKDDHMTAILDANQPRMELETIDHLIEGLDGFSNIDENGMEFLKIHAKGSWFNYLFDMPIDVTLISQKMSMCWYIADFWLLISLNFHSPVENDIRIFEERFSTIFDYCSEQERMTALAIDELDILRIRNIIGFTLEIRNNRLQDGRRIIGDDWYIRYDDELDANEDKTDRDYCRIIINNEWENMPDPEIDYSPSIPASRYGDKWIHMVSKYLLRPCDVQELCKCCKSFRTIDDEYRYNPYMLWNLDDFEFFNPQKKKYVRYEDAQNSFLLLDAKLCAKSYLVYRNLCDLWDLNESRKKE